ncbi:hypothetical protein HNY73_001440 [Argiope bruennichi]|uniref:Uncharacterized protein n=1 Tax=Argiope bruennichi TaxID=94029 RepID=A0A8T0G1A3_ARGBR|nr:hypothetical protein HNY73_001440 [Argiope bruennichi]
MLISDYGLLELIRFIFLELHHQHLLCRKCGMENMFRSTGLSFDDVHKFLSAKTNSDLQLALPVTFGNPSLDDASVALYVCKLVLLRGALLTSVCM